MHTYHNNLYTQPNAYLQKALNIIMMMFKAFYSTILCIHTMHDWYKIAALSFTCNLAVA